MGVNRYQRRSIRLKGYDYTQNGAYFVTICTHKRLECFGNIRDGEMVLNEWGHVVQKSWDALPEHFSIIELDAFVVMPNHIHGIICIVHTDDMDGSRGMIYHAPTPAFSKPSPNSLAIIVGNFKAAVTRHINRLPTAPDHAIWQRNYHEHIIRNAQSLDTLRAYITHNPERWSDDRLYVKDAL